MEGQCDKCGRLPPKLDQMFRLQVQVEELTEMGQMADMQLQCFGVILQQIVNEKDPENKDLLLNQLVREYEDGRQKLYEAAKRRLG